MFTVTVPKTEFYNDADETFIIMPEFTLELEHSLFSLSKWESKWEIPFLNSTEKTTEQTLSYIEMMTTTPNVPSDVYERLSQQNLNDINQYITAKMTATWFSDGGEPQRKSSETITAEIIYYWMVSLSIPPEYEHWHLNRLITLVKVINQKNAPEKKSTKSPQSLAAQRRAMNADRKKKYNTTG